jgi:hypothetical protein
MDNNFHKRQGQMSHLQAYFFLIGWCPHQPKLILNIISLLRTTVTSIF